MSYWILPESGIPEFCATVQIVTKLEAKVNVNKERFGKCDSKIKKRFKDDCQLLEKVDSPSIHEWEKSFYDDEEYLDEYMRVYNNFEVKEEKLTPDFFDNYLDMNH